MYSLNLKSMKRFVYICLTLLLTNTFSTLAAFPADNVNITKSFFETQSVYELSSYINLSNGTSEQLTDTYLIVKKGEFILRFNASQDFDIKYEVLPNIVRKNKCYLTTDNTHDYIIKKEDMAECKYEGITRYVQVLCSSYSDGRKLYSVDFLTKLSDKDAYIFDFSYNFWE